MSRRRALLPDPAGLFGLVVFLALAGSSGAKALRDGDTLWHIRFGEFMLERGELITRDTFSHTAYGQPWLAHEWLSEIIMALCYRFAGLSGVALMYFAVVALTFTLLFQTARRIAGDGPALAAMAIALPLAMTHLLARPHLFTWMGAAVTLFLLERVGRGRWLLVPLSALWANLHGGVLFGLIIQAVFLIGEFLDNRQKLPLGNWLGLWAEHRHAIVILSLSVAATCINPFGYHLFIFPFKVASPIFAQEINEWKSPNFQAMWYLRLWIIGLFLCSAWIGKNISWRWRLLAVFMLWQTLGHVRHASLMAMLLTPLTAFTIHALCRCRLFENWRERRATVDAPQISLSPWTGPVLTTVCFVLAIALTANPSTRWQSLVAKSFPLPENYSQGAIDFLNGGYPGKHLLNQYEWGDYLLYALVEPPKVFIDGRADMYGEQIFADYLAMANLSPDMETLLHRYDIDWLVFPSKHPLVRIMSLKPDWQTLYRDEQAVILAKTARDLP